MRGPAGSDRSGRSTADPSKAITDIEQGSGVKHRVQGGHGLLRCPPLAAEPIRDLFSASPKGSCLTASL